MNSNNNNLQLLGKFIQNDGGVIDPFTITKQVVNPPLTETQCTDGIDNDGDGDTDAEDTDCPLIDEICNNGLDDDGDGDIDAQDSDCPAPPLTETQCTDEIDNDGDGDTDAEDPDCPLIDEICNNGLDDDRDGDIDAQDPDCQTGYHYAPFFTTAGSTFVSVADSPSLRLSSFTVATWFKTTGGWSDEGIMVNKGGLGFESAGGNQNYGLWFTSSDRFAGRI